MNLRHALCTILGIALAFSSLEAQTPPRPRALLDVLGVEYGPRTSRAETDEPATAGADFVIGRDNLAFSNLTGIWGDPGDCYAFTVTSKLFFEGARWNATGNGAVGFSFPDLVRHFQAGGTGRFDVQGYPSLFDMTNAPALTEDRAVALMRGEGEEARGQGPLANLQGREKMKYQLILFLNMVQNLVQSQAELAEGVRQVTISGLTRAGRSQADGEAAMTQAVRRLTLESLGQIKETLRTGSVCPISMINLRELGGHAILAYKYVKERGHTDIYVYDSNVQAGDERGESVLRISTDASSITYHKKSGGRIEPDGIYDGSNFFSDKVGLAVLAMKGFDRATMTRLANTVAFASEVNMFLDATNRLVDDLRDGNRTLRRIVREFIIRIQGTQDRLGLDVLAAGDRITETSTVEQINRFLEAHSEVALRTITPHALPPGFHLDSPKLVLHPTDENQADIEARVAISEGAPVASFVRSIQSAGLLMNDRNLSSWATAVQKRVGDVHLSLAFGMRVQKVAPGGAGIIPASVIDLRGIVPDLRWLHGMIGRGTPSAHSTFVRNSPYRVEITREAMQNAIDVAAEGLKLYGDDAEILRFDSPAGDVDVRVDSTRLELGRSERGTSGVITLNTEMKMMVRGHELGLNPLSTQFRVDHNQRDGEQIRMSGRIQGNLDLPSGLRNLTASTALDIVNANGDAVRRIVNEVLTEDLLEKALGVRLLRFNSVDRLAGLAAGPQRISAVTDWATFDLAAARRAYFDFDIPIRLCQFHIGSDRILFAARRNGDAAADLGT